MIENAWKERGEAVELKDINYHEVGVALRLVLGIDTHLAMFNIRSNSVRPRLMS